MHTIIEDLGGEVLMHLDHALPVPTQAGIPICIEPDGPALAVEFIRFDLSRYPHAMVLTVRDTGHKFNSEWRDKR